MDGLTAPARVPVEVTRLVTGDGARLFRLSTRLGPGRVELGTPAPLVDGEPVDVRFLVPGDPAPVEARARAGAAGDCLELDGVLAADRERLLRYVKERLELPDVG